MRRGFEACAAVLLVACLLLLGEAGQVIPSKKSSAQSVWVNKLVLTDGFGATPYHILAAADGGAFVIFDASRFEPPDGETVIPFVTRLDGRGRAVWQTAFPEDNDYLSYPRGIIPSADGGCFVIPGQAHLVRLTASGSVVWRKRIWDQAYPYWNYPLDGILRAPGGGAYCIRGTTIIRVDASGTAVWGKRYDPGLPLGWALSAEGASGGSLLVTRAADDGVYHLARLDADGGIVWQRSFKHAEKTYIISVFPREDGGYIMQGYFSGRSSRQTWIIRLDAEGGLVWSRSYDAGSGMRARREAGDGGDLLISNTHGLLRLDVNGLLTAALPISRPDYLLCAVPAVDGGYYLGGGGGIAKTDASGWVANCSLISQVATGSSLETWQAGSASFTSTPISVGIEDLPFTPQPLAGTWSVVCRDPNYFYLTLVGVAGGTTNPPPGMTSLERGSIVAIEAIPEAYHDFLDWIGDVPVAFRQALAFPLTMDGDKRVQPRFLKIQAPLNLTGSRLLSPMRPWAFDVLTWMPHPGNQSIEKYCVFAVVDEVETLLGEVPADALRFVNRKAPRGEPVAYAVCAVTASGREGIRAPIEIR